jgi:hypothetical protein
MVAVGVIGCAGEEPQRVASPEAAAAEIIGADLDRVKSVWREVGASWPGPKPTVFKTTGRPGDYANGPFTADVFRLDLDGSVDGVGSGSDAVVRVGDPASWDWQLLAFLATPDGWRFAGSVDLPEQRVGAPVPRSRTLGPGRTWLIVDANKQMDRSITEREAVWYQVRDGRVAEVLRTPLEGHRVGLTAPFDVAYRAEVLNVFLTPDNHPAVTVNVEAVYSNARRDAFPGLSELFRRSGVVRFVQMGEAGRFVMETADSDWTKEELAGLLTESADQFVQNNRVQLVELANSQDVSKRQWVSRLRQDCATPEIRREVSALVTVDTDK